MSFKKRWSWWRERRKNFPPDDIHRAGELAEMRLAKLSRAAGKKNGWKIYESVRIPDPDGGRREIDLVIIGGNQILIIEQKHWSGSFIINNKKINISAGCGIVNDSCLLYTSDAADE